MCPDPDVGLKVDLGFGNRHERYKKLKLKINFKKYFFK
jgi:hypothetical protein